ncbi:related to cellulase precursor [Ramularia collo-cygni]|uniref:Endoglucanase EG-II n=1 Tax=Ramularia collo-cygni TaxID=112498 RepID=A0A2D3V6F9_9PEZI|nr:related to cellulase precursor [Ramularia collo-cygni]CZT24976.1 related to cellulase precursor [Ramularia collo-cygni]
MKLSSLAVASVFSSVAVGQVQFAGVNIAGLDFGCDTLGNCNPASTAPPGQAGIDQMQHFVKDRGLNAFRMPVSWQYVLNSKLGGALDPKFAAYNNLVHGCMSSGAAMCIIDIHNYARWNGGIIGQGGPTNQDFASLWSQLATIYKSYPQVVFGIMNEPHDLDIAAWKDSVQAAVTAIRAAGATSQRILLPSSNYSSAGNFVKNSASTLSQVVNLDGSTTNLIFEVHQYLDATYSGQQIECAHNNVAEFTSLATWLRSNGRQAMLTETGGGGSADSCLEKLCEQFDAINANSDVYLGWTAWSAGSFKSSYKLSLTPTLDGDTWTDVPLLTQCVAGKFKPPAKPYVS